MDIQLIINFVIGADDDVEELKAKMKVLADTLVEIRYGHHHPGAGLKEDDLDPDEEMVILSEEMAKKLGI